MHNLFLSPLRKHHFLFLPPLRKHRFLFLSRLSFPSYSTFCYHQFVLSYHFVKPIWSRLHRMSVETLSKPNAGPAHIILAVGLRQRLPFCYSVILYRYLLPNNAPFRKRGRPPDRLTTSFPIYTHTCGRACI